MANFYGRMGAPMVQPRSVGVAKNILSLGALARHFLIVRC
jgi:hypothetical protein